MTTSAAKFNAMRTRRYHPASTRFPLSVYPEIEGIKVQFIMDGKSTDLISQQGQVCNVSYINKQLKKVADAIVAEDTTPHFEEVDWKSGVVIEGVLSAESASVMDEISDDLVGDFGNVAGAHFVAMTAIPYKFWLAGNDRYDIGMRRATLMRAMAKLGMLAAGNKSNCWLLPRYAAKNEYQMMVVCDRLEAEKTPHMESELSFKAFPKLPVKNGMIYDFTLPWTGKGDQLQVPSISQIEDGLL